MDQMVFAGKFRPKKGKPAYCKNAASGSQPLPPPTRAAAQKHIEWIMARSRRPYCCGGGPCSPVYWWMAKRDQFRVPLV